MAARFAGLFTGRLEPSDGPTFVLNSENHDGRDECSPANPGVLGMEVRKLPYERVRADMQLVTPTPSPATPALGAFVSIARFSMSGRVFPPHPHAAFTAMAYMLEHSPSAMMNRDSLGFTDIIAPGSARWAIANSGMMHEEMPLDDGAMVEGFQIPIDQLTDQKSLGSTRGHAEPEDLPRWGNNGVSFKLILGELAGRAFHPGVGSGVLMLQISADRPAAFALPRPDFAHVAIYVERGQLRLADGQVADQRTWTSWPSETGVLEANATEPFVAFLFAADGLPQTGIARGPFILPDAAALDDAFRRFRVGAMGRLETRDL